MHDLHDSSFKLWFDHPRMVRDLLRGFLPADLAGAFDFDTLEQMSAQHVGDDLRQTRGDMLWRVRFRTEAAPEWLYLLVLLEFQSTVDRHMAARVLAYTGQTYLKLIREDDTPMPDGKLPPVLPIVIYNGRPRWSAPEEVGETIAAVEDGLAPFQPRQRYLLIDEHAMRAEDLPAANVVSAQIELEQGSVASIPPVLHELAGLLAGPRYASLRRGFAEWTRRVVERSRPAAVDPGLVGALKALEEAGDLGEMGSLLAERIDEYVEEQIEKGIEQRVGQIAEQRVEQLAEQIAEQRAQQIVEQRAEQIAEQRAQQIVEQRAQQLAEQIVEHRAEQIAEQRTRQLAKQYLAEGLEQERALVSRLAARKFDAETAARLAELLNRVDDPECLAEIGEQVIDCATGAELLARARRAAGQDRQPADRRRPQSTDGQAAP